MSASIPDYASLVHEMTPDEIRYWLRMTRAALERKQAREREYLDRRTKRGWHTPDDEAFEVDQLLEAHIIALLNECALRLT